MLGLGKQKTLQATHSRLWRVAECATVAAAGGLSFRELEALSSTCETWFLTLTRARITLHMTVLLERHAEICVELFKCTGDAEANCACLTVEASTLCFDCDVDLVGHLHGLQRRERCVSKLFGFEVGAWLRAVDDYFASATCEADASSGCLPTADGYKCFFAHYIKSILGLTSAQTSGLGC